MKTKKFIIKPVALFLAVITMIFTLSSCGYKPEPPEENAFELVMDFAQTMVKAGDKVTYKAILKNAEHESYTLQHPGELIHICVVRAEDYPESEADSEKDSVLAESDIAPHGQIEEFYEFKTTKRDEYILKAYTSFTIEGKETSKDYKYECKEIKITVY